MITTTEAILKEVTKMQIKRDREMGKEKGFEVGTGERGYILNHYKFPDTSDKPPVDQTCKKGSLVYIAEELTYRAGIGCLYKKQIDFLSTSCF